MKEYEMLLKSWYAPSFGVAEQTSARRTASSAACSTPISLQTICAALREGFAAHCKYEDLRSRGIPHDTAIKKALGIRAPAARTRTITSAQCRYPVSPRSALMFTSP
jgi:hypothetical protein